MQVMKYKKKIFDLFDDIGNIATDDHIYSKKNIQTINIIRDRILKQDKENQLFQDFALLQRIMIEAKLDNNEKVSFFFDVLEKDVYVIKKVSFLYNSELSKKLLKLNVDQDLVFDIMSVDVSEKRKLEIIKTFFPKKAKHIWKMVRRYVDDLETRKKGYKILRENYYEKKRISDENVEKIHNALYMINVPEELINLIIKVLLISIIEREIIKSIPKKTKKTHYDFSNWKFEMKSRLSEKEYISLNQQVEMYYDQIGKIPKKPLDIVEKIKLTEMLLRLGYQESEIKDILWQFDEEFPMKNLSTSNQIMRKASIIRLVLEKAKTQASNDLEILDTLAEITEIKSMSEDKEKQQWNELLLETIDHENRVMKEKLQEKWLELKSIRGNQKNRWRELYLEEIENEKHSSVVLFYIILNNLKSCPTEEKAIWKQRLIDTLTRMQLECMGNYEYEINEAKKVRVKDKK